MVLPGYLQSWYNNVTNTLQRRNYDSTSTVLRRSYHGTSTILSQYFDSPTTVLRQSYHGTSTIISRYFDNLIMVLRQSYHGTTIVLRLLQGDGDAGGVPVQTSGLTASHRHVQGAVGNQLQDAR